MKNEATTAAEIKRGARVRVMVEGHSKAAGEVGVVELKTRASATYSARVHVRFADGSRHIFQVEQVAFVAPPKRKAPKSPCQFCGGGVGPKGIGTSVYDNVEGRDVEVFAHRKCYAEQCR